MIKIVYVTHDGLMNSVFESQVLALLRFLSKTVGSITLLSFERNPSCPRLKEKIRQISLQFNGEVIVLPKGPFLCEKSLRLLSSKLIKVLSQRVLKYIPVILHCRGQVGAYIGIMAKKYLPEHKVKVIADIRGLPAEELLHKCLRNPKFKELILLASRYKAYKNIEKFVYSRADFLSCVSTGLKDYIVDHFDVPFEKIEIIPCSVDTKRFFYEENSYNNMRETLKLKDKIVFTYCGSMEAWQRVDKIIEFFVLTKRLLSKAHLLLLIRGGEKKIIRMLARYNLNKEYVTLLNLAHQDVPQFLRACDVGLIFRENNLLNSVSFPTKFGEYLSSGLFVISTKVPKEIDRFVQTYKNVGFIIKSFPDFDNKEIRTIISLLENGDLLSHGNRMCRYRIAMENIATDLQYLKYEKIYRLLAQEV